MIDNKVFNIFLLCTIIGEFALPFVLKYFYDEYDSKTMVMSALGNPKSPVRIIYNIWLIWLGSFLSFTAVTYFNNTKGQFFILSILLLLSIINFSIGAGICSGIFSVNEYKEEETIYSKIHGVGSVIGFMSLLFFPLINGIIAFKQGESLEGLISFIAFILSCIFFAMFIMGDKDRFKDTFLELEGLFERLTLFCMYIPFIYKSVYILIFK